MLSMRTPTILMDRKGNRSALADGQALEEELNRRGVELEGNGLQDDRFTVSYVVTVPLIRLAVVIHDGVVIDRY